MSIRPVDMQVILPHVTDVGKVQAVQNDQAATSQQLFAEKLQREAQMKQEQVQESKRAEFGKVTRDKEKEQQQKGGKKKQQMSPGKEDKDANEALQEKKMQQRTILSGMTDPIRGKNLDVSS